ncbi:UTP--glucose-1-phosphate uridylyltransferase GalU [Veronia pacifica]|uniref:UTP--glucose-1-phosphate uridylyltransferase n=1 Tax=Veronia pacifica TaxID=1080227 RepID=A0A1C3ELQ5_9GAMM|nr:UTP--glucose-1-phosphate uridylyltransferase GalU [Veronia pacifica]ODA34159.1 UTP--glucose-1-phosphate uridylyltransferase [Veronia pacifica]
MINKCLFPAAGYGTRFLPATKAMPKEMMPVVNKPLIQYGVEEALAAGISSMCIVTGRGKHALMDHFDKSFELEHQIAGTKKEALLDDLRHTIGAASYTFTRQSDMLGLGHAVLTGREMIGDEPFALILADDLCVGKDQGVLSQLIAAYEEFHCSVIAVEEVPAEDTHKYGIIEGREIRKGLIKIDNLIEKPQPNEAPSRLAVVGRYILTPDIFEILASTPAGKNGEIQLTDALLSQTQTTSVLACKFEGLRFDCGTVEGFISATNYCYKNNFAIDKDI